MKLVILCVVAVVGRELSLTQDQDLAEGQGHKGVGAGGIMSHEKAGAGVPGRMKAFKFLQKVEAADMTGKSKTGPAGSVGFVGDGEGQGDSALEGAVTGLAEMQVTLGGPYEVAYETRSDICNNFYRRHFQYRRPEGFKMHDRINIHGGRWESFYWGSNVRDYRDFESGDSQAGHTDAYGACRCEQQCSREGRCVAWAVDEREKIVRRGWKLVRVPYWQCFLKRWANDSVKEKGCLGFSSVPNERRSKCRAGYRRSEVKSTRSGNFC